MTNCTLKTLNFRIKPDESHCAQVFNLLVIVGAVCLISTDGLQLDWRCDLKPFFQAVFFTTVFRLLSDWF